MKDIDDKEFHSVYVQVIEPDVLEQGPERIAAGFFHGPRFTTRDFAQRAIDGDETSSGLLAEYAGQFPNHFVRLFPVRI